MYNQLSIIVRLSLLRFRRSIFFKWNLFTSLLIMFLGFLFLIQLILFAWFSEDIISFFAPDRSTQIVVNQVLFVFISLIFLMRLLMNNSFNDLAFILYRMNMKKRNVTFWHLILNTINVYWLFLILISSIVVFRSTHLYEQAGLLFVQQIVICTIFELLLLIYNQYCNVYNTIKYLLFVTGYIISNLFLYAVLNSFGLIVWLFFSLGILLFLVHYAKMSTDKTLYLDQTGSITNEREYNPPLKLSNIYLRIILSFFFRTKALRNGSILTAIVYAGLMYFVCTQKVNPGLNSLLILLSSLAFCLFYAPILFSPDYLWIGFLMSGIADLKSYVRSKLIILLYGCLIVLILNILVLFFTRLLVFRILPFYSLYFMGTLPYLYCWVRIRTFNPSKSYDRNNILHINPNAKEDIIILLPIVSFGYLVTRLIATLLGYDTVFDLPIEYYFPLASIGGLGLLLHHVWVKKLVGMFESKRFNIYEVSESV